MGTLYQCHNVWPSDIIVLWCWSCSQRKKVTTPLRVCVKAIQNPRVASTQ